MMKFVILLAVAHLAAARLAAYHYFDPWSGYPSKQVVIGGKDEEGVTFYLGKAISPQSENIIPVALYPDDVTGYGFDHDHPFKTDQYVFALKTPVGDTPKWYSLSLNRVRGLMEKCVFIEAGDEGDNVEYYGRKKVDGIYQLGIVSLSSGLKLMKELTSTNYNQYEFEILGYCEEGIPSVDDGKPDFARAVFRTTTKRPTTKRPSANRATTKKPSANRNTTKKPTANRNTTKKPTANRNTTRKPTANRNTTKKPPTKRPSNNRNTTRKPPGTKPTTKRPSANRNTTKKPKPPTKKPKPKPPAVKPISNKKPTTKRPVTPKKPSNNRATTAKPKPPPRATTRKPTKKPANKPPARATTRKPPTSRSPSKRATTKRVQRIEAITDSPTISLSTIFSGDFSASTIRSRSWFF